MRITEQIFSAFFAGAIVGSIITYWYTTREKRIISKIRHRIEFLGSFHDLTKAQYRKTMDTTELAEDADVLSVYRWGQKVKDSGLKLDPISIAAEAIICEKLLGRSRTEAVKALSKAKRADDLRILLPNNSN